jgi:DNA gyrase subunit A
VEEVKNISSDSPYNVMADIEVPESLKVLVRGYSDYAKEVVMERAIVGIDGFKPSQRRSLYTMKYVESAKDLKKSGGIVGSVLKLHPHGDASVYETIVRMVSNSMYAGTPFITGKGGFGKVYSTGPASAMRYTNVKLSDLSEELFGEMDGVKMVPSFDGKYTEPELLPVSFPNILTNTNSGIAVGLASNIASSNFHEVIDATIELIETGDIKALLAPDFTTKGEYVYNEKELRKLMETGKARFKLRGKWHIEGKIIVIDEIPYYTTIEAIMKKIDKAEISGIYDTRDESDKRGLRIAIECSSKKVVDQVLTDVLRYSDLQMTMKTNITVIIDNKPRVLGIKELLKEWVKFRSSVLEKQTQLRLESVERSIPRYEILVALLSDEARRQQFIERLVKGEGFARQLLQEWFKGAPEHIFDWILDMKLRQLSGLDAKLRKLQGYRDEKALLETELQDISKVVIRKLKQVNSRYSFPRQTEITEVDYEFETSKNTQIKAAPTPTLVVIDGKFIKKIRHMPTTDHIDATFRCKSDDIISFIDDKGRLLRVNLDSLDFVSDKDRGVYLPAYLEVEDDFEVLCHELVEEKTVGYVYSDGYASVIDYSEWVDNKRTTRMTPNGISQHANLLMGEIDFTKAYVLLMTNTGKFGFVSSDFKHKNRTARTKIVDVKNGEVITFAMSISSQDMLRLVNAPMKYVGKLSLLSHGDVFNGDLFDSLQQ